MKNSTTNTSHDKLIKILQAFSFAFWLVALVLCIFFILKYDISISNAHTLAGYIKGGTVTVALMIIGFNVLKSFSLVFPPVVLFVLSGLIFDDFCTAVLVSFISTACNLVLPYFLGRFTGIGIVNSLKEKFKAIKKIDAFTGENSAAIVFLFKACGLLPSDLSSLIFGAMNIPFWKYFISANIGLLIPNILWTLVSTKGDLTDPFSYLYAAPILLLTLCSTIYMRIRQKKMQPTFKQLDEEAEENKKHTDK